jgi:hypothetical protein
MRSAPWKRSCKNTGYKPKKDKQKEVDPMLTRLIKAVVVAALLAMVIDSLPDIKRYLEIREM